MSALFDPVDPACPGDPARESLLREFTVLDANIYNDHGPLLVIDGIGHDRARLLDYATRDDALGGWYYRGTGRRAVLSIEDSTWSWTPRIKHCEPYTDGWGCDQEGEWHRHLVATNGGEPLTLIGLALTLEGEGPAIELSTWHESVRKGRAA